MERLRWTAAAALLLALYAHPRSASALPSITDAPTHAHAERGPDTCGPTGAPTVQKVRFEDGDGLWRVLGRARVPREDIGRVVAVLSRHAKLTSIPPGRELELRRDAQGRLLSLEQRPTPEIAQCVERDGETAFTLRMIEVPIETELALVAAPIARSLAATLAALGEKPALGYLLRELFVTGGADPFARADTSRFAVVVEKRLARGELVGYGRVLAAELHVTGGERRRAFAYAPRGGEAGHYTGDGRLIAPPSLRLPIRGAQLTSGYGVREHPLSGKSHAHQGIDFAAPEGTEVRAAADGVVDLDASGGDLGNFVSIHHAGELTTRYAHLSAFAPGLSSGRHVKKGALIGYVGQTGLATGPHLHFETVAGGEHLDPARFLGGPGTPLGDDALPAFHEATAALRALLEAGAGDDM